MEAILMANNLPSSIEEFAIGHYSVDESGEYQAKTAVLNSLAVLADGSIYDYVNETVIWDGTNQTLEVGSGSGTDTRVDLTDGTTTVTDPAEATFTATGAASVTVSDDGDDTATIEIGATDSDTDTRVETQDAGATLYSDTSVLNIDSTTALGITDDGSGTVTLSATDTNTQERTRQATIPLTEIADTNTAVGLRKQVPSGKTLEILEIGVSDDTGSAPSGLTIEVYDHTNSTAIVSQNILHAEGSPIASKAGAIDVSVRVANGTGGTVNASGYVLYTME
jgi:hypothetical protein